MAHTDSVNAVYQHQESFGIFSLDDVSRSASAQTLRRQITPKYIAEVHMRTSQWLTRFEQRDGEVVVVLSPYLIVLTQGI
jgi:hypothetical protein